MAGIKGGGIKSRAQREREARLKAKRNRSQLLGPQAQGKRAPIQKGFQSQVTGLKAPEFKQSNIGGDLLTAGLAFKGGKGVRDFDYAGAGSQLSNMGTNALADINQLFAPSGTIAGPKTLSLADFPKSTATPPGVNLSSHTGFPMEMGLPTGKSGTGLRNIATANPAALQSVNMMGALSGGLGAGMSIYDMAEQGITPGNAMGLLGGLGIGASAFPSLGLAGLGPIGWGLAGVGAAGSLFDWW